jgi:uncharacterized protein YndB with AHSA1/START domain
LSEPADHPAEDLSLREIVTTRILAFPRELVFRAWTDPDHLPNWWGPKGFTNTLQELDLRPGGRWRIVMHGPNGTDYPNESVFVEIVPPERIVFDHLEPIHRIRTTVTLAAHSGGTALIWRMLFATVAECDRVRSFVSTANEQNLDRLEAELARMA